MNEPWVQEVQRRQAEGWDDYRAARAAAIHADHLSAIMDLAKTVGIKLIHDSGLVGLDRVVVFGDKLFARSYNTGEVDGVAVRISFNERGEVETASKRVHGVPKGDVTGEVGNAGQRLLWTLHLFSRR